MGYFLVEMYTGFGLTSVMILCRFQQKDIGYSAHVLSTLLYRGYANTFTQSPLNVRSFRVYPHRQSPTTNVAHTGKWPVYRPDSTRNKLTEKGTITINIHSTALRHKNKIGL